MDLSDRLKLAWKKLRSARRILLVGHVNPDADALASLGALIEVVRGAGLDFYAYAANKSRGYSFIPNEPLISSERPDLSGFDLVLVMDCGSLGRTGLEPEIRQALTASPRPYFIEFDHHEPQDAYADLEIRLPDKASTTEVIYHFLRANKLEISKPLADCILTGLLTDTGYFLHANFSKETVAVSSEMLLRGASLSRIISHTAGQRSFPALRVWGRALENIYFDKKSGLIISALSRADLKELVPPGAGLDPEIFGDIVSFLSNIQDALVAVLLREEESLVKGSLRTNKDINVAKIAKIWGGGGHQKAAGFSVGGRLIRKKNGSWAVFRK